MHALRNAYQGIELLRSGRISLPVPEPERSALRAVRSGNVPLDEVLARRDRVTAELAAACDTPGLPAQSDVAAVDAVVVSAYRRAWDARD
jgi:hypothetical protein